ncbi:hypothetical protein EV702DRAFT_1058093 [Suillus placidus]|uniref:Uncharacterized protein n=1 Tax=Suillus placidus TaxID=48579 RepID=A0A9P7DA59_9AGAM|nr:hypothetical protein EV702DRAFT_1058093 [Suillus placidus]
MNFWKFILRTVSVVLSSFGILLSLLAIFVRTLVPSVFVSWPKPPPDTSEYSQRTIACRVKRPVPGPVASPASSSLLESTKSNNTIHSNMVDGAVPQSHARVDSPMPATELSIQRFNRSEVLEAHKIFKRHTLSVCPSFNVCRTIASPKQRSTHLKGRSSTGSFSHSLKNPNPPLRTQPYAAPYFFPAPGTPEAIGYVTKTREELLRPSTDAFTLKKKNKRTFL